MALDSARGNADGGRHLFADLASGEELHDFQFAGGERTAGDGVFGAVGVLALIVDKGFHHGHREAAGKERLVLLDVANGGDQFGIRIGFQDVTARAAAENFAGDIFGKMHGEDQDFRVRRLFANDAGDFEAIHFGHGEIEEDEVRFGFFDVLDSFDAIGSFAAYLQAGLRFKEGTDPASHNSMIIRYENAIRLGRYRFFGHVIPLGRQK
jgi:hypothetical protein